jgi:hypothetical protein
MEFLTWLQNSAVSRWVAGSPSLLAYPTILTLHTVGMAIVVGTCAVMALRTLGVAPDMPFSAFRHAHRLVWGGFSVNAASGLALFAMDAEHKATQTVFYVKLALIALALVCYAQLRRRVFVKPNPAWTDGPIGGDARALAVASLILWTAATVAGRLMAYMA